MSNKMLLRLLEDQVSRSVEICQELVRCPSEDPPGDTREVASYIESLLSQNGINTFIVSPHPEKPSVIATIEGKHPGKHFVFNGHIDTFPVGDISQWTQDPFGGRIVDGKLYGRGSADMKGGVASILAAALLLNQIKDQIHGKITLTCVSDEEVSGPWGTSYILENYPELFGDALVNGEPSSLEHIRIGEKGIYQVRLTVSTKGGHGAYAGLKTNAIIDAMDMLGSLLDFGNEAPGMDQNVRVLMEKSRISYDRILSTGALDAAICPSVNVGTINGGIMPNMVPEKCCIELDFRLPPGVSVEFTNKWLNNKLERFPNVEAETIKSMDAHLTSPVHPLVQIAHRAAEESYGHPVYENYSLGGTEACLWRSKGVPAVTYGPSHHNMGSPDEYVLVDELPIVARVHALTAWRYLNEFNEINDC